MMDKSGMQSVTINPELRRQGVLKQIQEFKRHFGWIGFIQLIFHPIILAATTPIRFFQTIQSLSCLASEPWSAFARLSAQRSLNSSWHRASDVLMEKYGRNGYAYDISLGYNLTTIFFLTKFSARLYRHNEVVIPWLGTLVMALSQLIWLETNLVSWVILVTVLAGLFSTLFYFGAFEALKYDSLGWALVPLGYYTLLTGNFWGFTLVFLAITFLSVSVTIVQGSVWFFLGFLVQGPWVILAFLPGAFKILTHFKYIFHGKSLTNIHSIFTFIGLSGTGAKLRRLRLTTVEWYFLGLWSIYLAGVWILAQPTSISTHLEQLVLTSLPILFYLVNKGFRRFADEQTIHMLAFCAFSLVALQQPHGMLLPILWLALSPMPLFLIFSDELGNQNLIWQVPPRQPYHLGPVRDACTAFMQPITQRDRVLFHFNYDPEHQPDADGLTELKEYLHYLALERQAIIIPDEYLLYDDRAGRFPLAELYKDDSPQGRQKAMTRVGARFLILPAQSPALSSEWVEAGFVVRTILYLVEGCQAGLWAKTVFRDGCTHLLLLEAVGSETSLTICGHILKMVPNCLHLQLDEKGEAIIRLLHSPGWASTASGVTVDAAPGTIPWIRVRGDANSVAELNFDYFRNSHS